MGRKNRNPHPPRMERFKGWNERKEQFDVDYVYLPEAPEIAAVIVPDMKTIYRNMCCAAWADEVHVVRDEDDRYLDMIRDAI